MAPRVAIIVPTKDARAQPATRCLEHVRRTTAHLDVEVHPVESSGPDFRFPRSINEGFGRAPDADAWVLLNDDAFMDDGWLDALLSAARAHPEVGIVGSVLRFEGGGIQHAGAHIPLTPTEFMRAAIERRAPFWALREMRAQRFQPYPYMFCHWHSVSPRHRLDFITAACCLVTRRCFDKVGPYDERYELGAEDADHSLRALEAGFELAIATRATGVHLEGASGQISARTERSLAAFRAKWSAERIARATRGRTGVYH